MAELELLVHVPGCGLVGEAVAGAAGDPFQALPGRGQQHRVVQALHTRGGGEGGQEPEPDNAVIDSVVSARGITPGRGGGGPGDYLVLGVGGGQPGDYRAAGDEREERVTLDQRAAVELVG
jgi:hypothetical protein